MDSVQDVLDFDLSVAIPKGSIPGLLLPGSPNKDLRRVFQERTVLFDWRGGGQAPEDLMVKYLSGETVAMAPKIYERIDGHRFRYGKDPVFYLHSGYIFTKGHWLKVTTASAALRATFV